MKQVQKISIKATALLVCFSCLGIYGQKQTKTYKETFTVGNDAVLNINTSYADIEFDTWDKNQVLIEAVVEVADMPDEDAEKYFKNNGVKIIGNSENIEVSTGMGNFWSNENLLETGQNFHFNFEMPEVPDVTPLIVELPEMPELHEIHEMLELHEAPPMPPVPMQNFDYEAYKKEGDKYLKKWKKEFDKNFDEDYKKRMEAWSKRLQARTEERRKVVEERSQLVKERQKEIAVRQEKMEKARADMQKTQADVRKAQQIIIMEQASEKADGQEKPNVFYFNTNGEDKNIKVKRTIKIKMPKAVKLRMNVRHGEVKLAENTKNIKATLSYARLLAATIDGDNTTIAASYSPLTVQKWNYGQLKVDYSDNVDLKEVTNLNLSATSSNITIEHLLKKALIKNDFGSLKINTISKNFSSVNVSVKNGELWCKLPETPFLIKVNDEFSEFTAPSKLTLAKTKGFHGTMHQGYYRDKNSSKSIDINSKYSEIVLE